MGFFDKKEINYCNECGLNSSCKNPEMEFTGEGKLKTLIINKETSKADDEEGFQMAGESGVYFRDLLEEQGYDLEIDFWKTNVLKCKTNKKPSKKQLKLCKHLLDKEIKELKPNFIILLGATAVESFYQGKFSKTGITRWRRFCVPDPETNAWILPLYHPNYILQNEKDKGLEITFKNDLIWVLSCLKRNPPEFSDFESQVECLVDIDKIEKVLNNILEKEKIIAFDYETTGIKPYNPGHAIVSIGIATETKAYSFPYQYINHFNDTEQAVIYNLWRQILNKEGLLKVLHNYKYEEIWSRNIFNKNIKDVHWCTMNTAHILDDRQGVTGLKFQTYVNYGFANYEEKSKQYIEADKENEFNRMNEMPLNDLLMYNGLDALFTMKLYKDQYKILSRKNDKRRKANELTLEGLKVLVDVQENGICADALYFKEIDEELGNKIIKTNKELFITKEAKEFRRIKGKKIKPGSTKDLKELFFEIGGLKPEKETKKGSPSVDKESLLNIDTPFASKLMEIRKLEKIKNTYVSQFLREISSDDKIHPFFDLHTVRSFRSSSAGPNFQNIPIRDEVAKSYIRKGIYPSKGCMFICLDFSSMEVRVIAAISKDVKLVEYIHNPKSDLHMDQCKQLFKATSKEATKTLRFYSKNQWVFPQFYGSYFRTCARNLWKEIDKLKTNKDILTKDHLKEKGIKDYTDFENHLKECEIKFWKRFEGVKEWQERTLNAYYSNGYIDMVTGYRRGGHLSRNIVYNGLIQGCLNGNSKILTNVGWFPIKELVDKEVKVWTGFKWAKAIGVNMGESQLATIELESGLTINCDIRHKLKNQFNEWVDFNNFKENDWVALPKMNERVDSEIEVDWFFVLGFILGDGSYRERIKNENNIRYTLNISGADSKKDILCAIKDFLEEQGLKTYWRKIQPTENRTQIRYNVNIYEKKIKTILDSFGYNVCEAHDKQIPDSVWKASYKQQANFLDGLLLADGSRYTYSLHMCNEKLLKEVQLLSYGLGYDSSIKKTKNGFKLSFRQIKKYSKKYVKVGRFLNTSNRRYPRDGFDKFMENKEYKLSTHCSIKIANKRAIRSGKPFTQTVAERIINELDPNYEIYRYDKIKKITIHNKIEETYTMSVNDNLHQFVADGVITKNSAFHCLLWSMIKINNILKKRYRSRIVAEIHDEIIIDTYPEEQEEIIKLCNKVMTQDIREHWDWITVPLEIEVEMTPVDGSWYYKKTLK